MKDRAQIILETAAQTGVCRTGKRYLKQTPKDTSTLIKLMKAWPEYIQEHPDSALAIFRENMTDDLQAQLVAANIFIDYQGEATIGSDTAVMLLGATRVDLNTEPFAVIKIYAFHTSKAVITPADNAIIDVEAWNDSSIGVIKNTSANTTGRQYDNAQIIGADQLIKVDHKRGEVFNGKENNN
jgi:hypothetical protein